MVYLDNSATTRPCPEAVAAVTEALEVSWHNPSALYSPALAVEKRLRQARALCLKAAGAGEDARLIFTGSGTEADNLAILGHLRTLHRPGEVLVFAAEHPAVSACRPEIERLGHRFRPIPSLRDGTVNLTALEGLLGADTALICVMQVGNESGAIQPIQDIARLRDRLAPGAALHVDGVQGFLRVPFDFRHSGAQTYAFSGHKLRGPKGIGGLIAAKGHRLQALTLGGGQEEGLRSGTENVPGILGLAAAVAAYPADANARMAALKRRLWEGLQAAVPTARLNGPALDSPACAPHILSASLPPVRSQTMLTALEGEGVIVSAGSACASHKQKVSETLLSMGLTRELADATLRFSLCPDTTADDIDRAVAAAGKQWKALSPYVRR
ncbi:MAG: cysteine desulfurase [Clostridia bacterium]|nr:cysteine desulfurase [Clostridia bacterium]